MIEKLFETDEFAIGMADSTDLPLIGAKMIEIAIAQGVEEYEETGDFEEFKTPLVVSLSPTRFKALKIACEEVTTSRKDYHIVMSFIESLEKIANEKLDEITEEMEE